MMCAGRVEVKLRQSEIAEYERKLIEKEIEVGNVKENLKQQQKLLQELKGHSQEEAQFKIQQGSSEYQYAYMHMQCKNKMEEYEMKQRMRKLQAENLSYKMQLAMACSQKHTLETEMQALIQEVATLKTAQEIFEQKVLCKRVGSTITGMRQLCMREYQLSMVSALQVLHGLSCRWR